MKVFLQHQLDRMNMRARGERRAVPSGDCCDKHNVAGRDILCGEQAALHSLPAQDLLERGVCQRRGGAANTAPLNIRRAGHVRGGEVPAPNNEGTPFFSDDELIL